VGEFSNSFIPQIPPDHDLTLISRTIGTEQLVDEMVEVHSYHPDGLDATGITPTGKRVEVPLVAIIRSVTAS